MTTPSPSSSSSSSQSQPSPDVKSAIYESTIGSAPQRRRYRSDQIEAAYDIQRRAAIRGASAYTILGIAATTASHHIFPKFRSQTLALKAFIVSGFTIFGFVVGADTVLLNHESKQRSEEDLIRGVARRELAKKGILASEREIERWKEDTRERLLREQEKLNANEK